MTAAPIVCIMGPTACGKTDLAVRLVEAMPFDIISVDSALVYKGMDIGTAKPDTAILERAPHRLIDFLDPAEPYSAARFVVDAQREINAIRQQGRLPLLVGGTMLYFRALLHGMASLPAAEPLIREAIMQQAEQEGWDALHAELAQIDPDAAGRIHPNDPQRIQRALEVYRLTGKPISVWQRETTAAYTGGCIQIGLVPSDREVLRERIAQRFMLMLQAGLVDEVARLRQRGDLHLDMPAMRAVGYRQVWEYLEGNCAYAQMQANAITATRQLAKRQMTWLRAMPGVEIFDCLNKDLESKVLKYLGQHRIL